MSTVSTVVLPIYYIISSISRGIYTLSNYFAYQSRADNVKEIIFTSTLSIYWHLLLIVHANLNNLFSCNWLRNHRLLAWIHWQKSIIVLKYWIVSIVSEKDSVLINHDALPIYQTSSKYIIKDNILFTNKDLFPPMFT